MASSPSEEREKKIARAAAYNQMMDHFPIHSQEWASEWEKAISVYEVVEGAHNSNADLNVDAECIAANSLEDAEMDWIDIMNCIYFFIFQRKNRRKRRMRDNWLIKLPLFHSMSSSRHYRVIQWNYSVVGGIKNQLFITNEGA